jgi:hypothetical protein
MVMLREELPEKEDDPAPEVDMFLICAVVERAQVLSPERKAIAAEAAIIAIDRLDRRQGQGSATAA